MKQEIQIQNLKDNPGLLPLKFRQVPVQTSTHDFIHYYDLQPIAQEIASIETQYKAVSTAIQNGLSHPYFDNLQNFDQRLNFQLKTARGKLTTVYPSSLKSSPEIWTQQTPKNTKMPSYP